MRSPLQIVGEAVTDLRDVAVGWRWGHRRLLPRGADREPSELSPVRRPDDWARRLPIQAVRQLVQTVTFRPLLRAELQLDVGSRAEIAESSAPMVIVANHASRLDIPVLLESLPLRQRRRTGVAVGSDDLGQTGWRAACTVAYHTFPQPDPDDGAGTVPGELLETGWNVLIFPEGIRSDDGLVGDFDTAAAELAMTHAVPVLPVGIRGTFAAMPRGRAWPAGPPFAHSRHRVAVRFGPLLSPRPGESAESFTEQIAESVRTAIAEDRTTWWQSRRQHAEGYGSVDRDSSQPPLGSWRRIWEQSQSPKPGGRPRRPRIWRR